MCEGPGCFRQFTHDGSAPNYFFFLVFASDFSFVCFFVFFGLLSPMTITSASQCGTQHVQPAGVLRRTGSASRGGLGPHAHAVRRPGTDSAALAHRTAGNVQSPPRCCDDSI